MFRDFPNLIFVFIPIIEPNTHTLKIESHLLVVANRNAKELFAAIPCVSFFELE